MAFSKELYDEIEELLNEVIEELDALEDLDDEENITTTFIISTDSDFDGDFNELMYKMHYSEGEEKMEQLLTAEEAKNKTHNYKNDIMNQTIRVLNDQIFKACNQGRTSIVITKVEPSIREDLVTKLTELGYFTKTSDTQRDGWELTIKW